MSNSPPSTSPQDVQDNIASEHYFTAADGVLGRKCKNTPDSIVRMVVWDDGLPADGPLGLLTFCVLTMKNGAIVMGTHTCTAPESFDPTMGQKIARFDAMQKARPLMDYALKQRRSEQ